MTYVSNSKRRTVAEVTGIILSTVWTLARAHIDCPVGTFMDREGRCSWCTEGTYQDEVGAHTCKTCRPGMFSTEVAATSHRACRNCPKNTFASTPSLCSPCPPFTTSPSGASSPVECTPIAGYYGIAGIIGVECPANNYCTQGTTRPTPCPSGTISPAGSSQCTPGVQAVLLYDWIFASAWVALLVSGAFWMGAYKAIAECFRHTSAQAKAGVGVIRIQIIRDSNEGSGIEKKCSTGY